MHWQQKNGHLETVRWLLEAGADVNGSPLSVASPLITAVTFGQKKKQSTSCSSTIRTSIDYMPSSIEQPSI
ncbi:ankyrin repeat domain-containing protein [Pseudomonas lini]